MSDLGDPDKGWDFGWSKIRTWVRCAPALQGLTSSTNKTRQEIKICSYFNWADELGICSFNCRLARTACERRSNCFRLPNLFVAFIMIFIHSKENQETHAEFLADVNLKEHFIKGNSSISVVCGFVISMLLYCHYLLCYFLLFTTKAMLQTTRRNKKNKTKPETTTTKTTKQPKQQQKQQQPLMAP